MDCLALVLGSCGWPDELQSREKITLRTLFVSFCAKSQNLPPGQQLDSATSRRVTGVKQTTGGKAGNRRGGS